MNKWTELTKYIESEEIRREALAKRVFESKTESQFFPFFNAQYLAFAEISRKIKELEQKEKETDNE